MTDNQQQPKDPADARADAIATTAIFVIVITWVVFWLSGMPS
jgi:hypothetical protein